MSWKDKAPSRDTVAVSLLLLLSRPVGLLREMVFAWKLGVSGNTDAFFASFGVIEVLTDVVATGFLANAVIPIFAKLYHSERSRDSAWKCASLSLNTLALCSLGMVLLGEVFAGPLVRLVFPGFPPFTAEIAARSLRWLLPFLFLQAIATVLIGILQSLGDFIYVASVQFVQNFLIIGAVVLLAARFGVYSAVAGFLCFGVLQFLLLGRRVLSARPVYSFGLAASDPLLRSVIGLGAFTLLATLFQDASYLLNRVFASSLAEGSVSALAYAVRFKYVAVSLAAYPLATTLFPSMARSAQSGSEEQQLMSKAIRLTLWITLPAVLLLISERREVVFLVYQRGAFSAAMTQLTAGAVAGYAFGVIPYGLCILLQRHFLAQHRTAPAVQAYGLAIVANLAATPLLMRREGIFGLALAFSISEVVATAVLIFQLGPDRRPILAPLQSEALRFLAASLCAMIPILLLPHAGRALISKTSLLGWEAVRGLLCVAAYAAASYLLWGTGRADALPGGLQEAETLSSGAD